MTNEQTKELKSLEEKLLPRALEVGPMHSNWEYISDIRCAINGDFFRYESIDALIESINAHLDKWGY